ncbi:hypothetical protein FNF29_07516 [Cafeteria roenbergensis]|uniref:Uncharacterized protein n=1 Tax=Cafeteria roenbergensis TaxID=33653 RepID=A0A5A8C384_CAFRO|nr:hypothetical protein FNF29_07516 [Cafeteria roenbergensis]|eukprot:KAA0147255.1 hypothetical protein FNF29_07516 [Cafeteria roenbergensis]
MSAADAEVDRLERLRADQRTLEASRERLRQQGRQLRELLDAAEARAAQLRHAAKAHNADRDQGRVAAEMVAAAQQRTRAQQSRYAQLEAAFERARERARDAADDAAARRTASREVLAMEAIRVDKRETRLLAAADQAQDELAAAQAALAAVRARIEDADEVAAEAASLRRSWGRVLQAAQSGAERPATALQDELVRRTEEGHREQTAMRLALDRATADLSALKLGEAAVRGQLEATTDLERSLHGATAAAAADSAAAPHPLLAALPARLAAEVLSDPAQASLPAVKAAEAADGCVSAEAAAALTGSQRRGLAAAVAAAAAPAASLRVPGLAAARDAAEERGPAAPVAPILAAALNPAAAPTSPQPRSAAVDAAAGPRPAWLRAALGGDGGGESEPVDGPAESKASPGRAAGQDGPGASGVRFSLADLQADHDVGGAATKAGGAQSGDGDGAGGGAGGGGAERLASDLVAARVREAMAEAESAADRGVAADAAPAAPIVGGSTRDRRRLAPGKSSRRGTYFGAFKANGKGGGAGANVLVPLPEPADGDAPASSKGAQSSPAPRSTRQLIVAARRREAAALRALTAKSAPGLGGSGTFGSTGRPEDPWATFPRPANARATLQQSGTAAKSPLKAPGSAGRAGQRSSPGQSPASAGTAQGRRLRRESVSRVATYIHADSTERSLMAAVATRTITRKEAQDLQGGASAAQLEQQRERQGRKPTSSWKRGSFFGAFKGRGTVPARGRGRGDDASDDAGSGTGHGRTSGDLGRRRRGTYFGLYSGKNRAPAPQPLSGGATHPAPPSSGAGGSGPFEVTSGSARGSPGPRVPVARDRFGEPAGSGSDAARDAAHSGAAADVQVEAAADGDLVMSVRLHGEDDAAGASGGGDGGGRDLVLRRAPPPPPPRHHSAARSSLAATSPARPPSAKPDTPSR